MASFSLLRYERLVELVTMIGDKGELPIAMALASVVANAHMVSSFFPFFHTQEVL